MHQGCFSWRGGRTLCASSRRCWRHGWLCRWSLPGQTPRPWESHAYDNALGGAASSQADVVVSAAAVIIMRSARACARPSVRAPQSVAATGAASGRKPTNPMRLRRCRGPCSSARSFAWLRSSSRRSPAVAMKIHSPSHRPGFKNRARVERPGGCL
jgi:hypothetical protein